MKTTPWEEARRQAVSATRNRIYGPPLFGDTDVPRKEKYADEALSEVLATLRGLGWSLVPVEPTGEMCDAASDRELTLIEGAGSPIKQGVRAAISAGDVLRSERSEPAPQEVSDVGVSK